MKYLLAITFALFSSTCFAQIQRVSLPIEVKQEMKAEDDSIKNKQWNRWTSKNFIVCSLDDEQAKYLNNNLEDIKTWIYNRWGLKDTQFTKECRIICVDDKALFKKLFGLEQTKVEIRNNLYVIFLLTDDKPSRTISVPLTEVCLSQLELNRNAKIGWWAHRGMSILDGSIADIRTKITELYPLVKENKSLYFSKTLFTMTEEQYNKESVENRAIFDECSVIMCLLLRKEFGQDKFIQFLNSENSESSLHKLYGFKDYSNFDSSYKRYLVDLTSDIVGARKNRPKTPDSYLQIKAK